VGYSTPRWNELVIYELHVGSFLFDVANHRRGDFDTVISKLDYLADLGVNAVQIMPADEFPGNVSWGYNPAYIFAIEEAYGGPNGFRRLVDAAHARGMAVIFDVVYNHLGPNDLDLWKFDGWSPNGAKRKAESTSTTIGAFRHPGALGRTMDGARCASTSGTTCCGGWSSGSVTAFAGTRPAGSATSGDPTRTLAQTSRTAGACCSGSTARRTTASRGRS